MLHCVAVCPNAGKYQEFDLFSTRDANGNGKRVMSADRMKPGSIPKVCARVS
jgi:hypothetical protein